MNAYTKYMFVAFVFVEAVSQNILEFSDEEVLSEHRSSLKLLGQVSKMWRRYAESSSEYTRITSHLQLSVRKLSMEIEVILMMQTGQMCHYSVPSE